VAQLNSRIAPTPEEKSQKQGYTARCAGLAARCANARRSNCPCVNALRVAPEQAAHCADIRRLNCPTA
ncbi:hypothetical protein A2U01_0117452, partial [Trifolium medium]|nr:hypothetical protein [Trifolium medium]